MKTKINHMIAMNTIYSIFKSFILIFVNIYMWKTGKSMESVAIFNIFNYIAATVSFYLGNWVGLKNIRYNYLLSSIAFMLAFGLTAYLGEGISQYAIVIGILGGFGDGFFFFNLNTFQAGKLEPDAMDYFMSISSALKKVFSIVTPIVSGFVIEVLGFNAMLYSLLFLIAIQLYLSARTESHSIDSICKIDPKKILANKQQVKMLWTNIIISPYTQFTALANSVFLYSIVAREAIIGTLNSAFSVFSILMFALYRFLQRKFDRKSLMLFGSIASSVVLIMLLWPNIWTFIIFGMLMNVGAAMFQTPLVGVQLRSTKENADTEAQMLGNLLVRVIVLNTGRVIFFGFVYFFYDDFTSPIFNLFLIYGMIAPLLSYWIGRKSIEAY